VQGSQQPEKRLYRSISDCLRERGLEVWEEATIRAGDRGTRTADHLAWSWEGEELTLWAVEVKAGASLEDAGAALVQGLAYQVGIPFVYVAAEGSSANLEHLAGVLQRLNLGYMRAAADGVRAAIETEPTVSEIIKDSVHAENIARARLKHVFTDQVVGEPVKVGRDRRGDIWAVTGTTDRWQLCAQVVAEGTHTLLSLIAESTSLGKRVASPAKATRFAELFRRVRPGAQLIVRCREHRGYQPKYSDDHYSWCSDENDDAALKEVLGLAASLGASRVGPHFELRTELWPHSERLTQAAAEARLGQESNNLRRIRDDLNGLTFEK